MLKGVLAVTRWGRRPNGSRPMERQRPVRIGPFTSVSLAGSPRTTVADAVSCRARLADRFRSVRVTGFFGLPEAGWRDCRRSMTEALTLLNLAIAREHP